jgi:hypothetical protein
LKEIPKDEVARLNFHGDINLGLNEPLKFQSQST